MKSQNAHLDFERDIVEVQTQIDKLLDLADRRGMAFFTGDKPAHWRGSLFVGAREGTGLWRIQFDGTREVGRERLLADRNERIVDVRMGPDGYLYVLTLPSGGILRVGG
jgi:glucose/arabinose dehydrogenase